MTAISICDRWSSTFGASGDLALLRVDQPGPGALSARVDFGADLATHSAAMYGYDYTTSKDCLVRGTLKRIRHADGHDIFESDIVVAHGFSGSPFLIASNGVVVVVGVATWDTSAPSVSFKGLPLLQQTYGSLLSALEGGS